MLIVIHQPLRPFEPIPSTIAGQVADARQRPALSATDMLEFDRYPGENIHAR